MPKKVVSLVSSAPEISKETVTIKPGFTVPVRIRVESLKLVGDDTQKQFEYDVTLQYQKAKFAYGLEYVGLRKASGDIQSIDLRAIPIRRIMSMVRELAYPIGYDADFRLNTPEEYEALKKSADRKKFLRVVAFHAAMGRLTSSEQRETVAYFFNVTERTASRWIAEARANGFLD